MAGDQTSRDAFESATERLAYEKTNLPPILKRKVEQIEKTAEEKKTCLVQEQQASREQDLATERARQRLEHPAKTYEDLTADGVRKPKSKDEIERLAVHAVARRNALSLAAIDLRRDEKVDRVLALNRDTASPSRAEQTLDLGPKLQVSIGKDFYRAVGRER